MTPGPVPATVPAKTPHSHPRPVPREVIRRAGLSVYLIPRTIERTGMGVSVRLSRNVRMYLPFWVAIPAYLIAAAVWVVIGTVWVIAQLASAGLRYAGSRRRGNA